MRKEPFIKYHVTQFKILERQLKQLQAPLVFLLTEYRLGNLVKMDVTAELIDMKGSIIGTSRVNKGSSITHFDVQLVVQLFFFHGGQ